MGELRGVGDLVRRGQQAHERAWLEMVGSALTSTQFGVLLFIGTWPGGSQQRLSEVASIDKSTVGDVLQRLAARGLIERRRDPSDGRRNAVHLTEAGRDAVLTASPAAAKVGDRLLEQLEYMEGEALLQFLRRIAYGGEPPAPDDGWAPFAGWPLRLPPIRLDATAGHLLRRAQQEHGVRWRELVGATLTPVQFDALVGLAELGDVDQGTWAERIATDPATTASLTNRLRERGLLVQEADPGDKRRRLVSLTAAGRRTLDEVYPAALEVERQLLAPLLRAEQDRFVALLSKVRSEGREVE